MNSFDISSTILLYFIYFWIFIFTPLPAASSDPEEMHIEEVLESLKRKALNDSTMPSCVSSVAIMFQLRKKIMQIIISPYYSCLSHVDAHILPYPRSTLCSHCLPNYQSDKRTHYLW